jgi:hypothetical protein
VSSPDDDGSLELILASKKYGIHASAIEKDGEVTILRGSTATAKEGFTQNTYEGLRSSLVSEGVLIPSEKDNILVFNVDTTLPSPSAAAAVIFNRNSNGRTAWKVKATGQTLKDWQDAQLEQIVTEPVNSEQAQKSSIPPADAELSELLEYCMSLNGYRDGERTVDECFEIARSVEEQGLVMSDIEDLSVAAFIWQRGFVWGSIEEQPIYERKIRAVIDEMRSRQST